MSRPRTTMSPFSLPNFTPAISPVDSAPSVPTCWLLFQGDKLVVERKGDQVRVMLEATDFRGGRTGRTAVSDTLQLTVTDESGILSALSESDERSARQLDAIIRRQLGIGETP